MRLTHKNTTGFTLIELLVVLAIIATLASVILFSLSQARASSRDASRYQQGIEVLKALELHFTDTGVYPDDGDAGVGAPVTIGSIGGISTYMSDVPEDPIYPASSGYQYCSSADLRSMAILINTELDRGGSDYCAISRGVQQYTNNVCTNLASIDECADRSAN